MMVIIYAKPLTTHVLSFTVDSLDMVLDREFV